MTEYGRLDRIAVDVKSRQENTGEQVSTTQKNSLCRNPDTVATLDVTERCTGLLRLSLQFAKKRHASQKAEPALGKGFGVFLFARPSLGAQHGGPGPSPPPKDPRAGAVAIGV
jgi:hypothetical protein